jgi:hypothetical protein
LAADYLGGKGRGTPQWVQRPANAGEGRYETPRVTNAEAAGMVERLHGLYLRTLRALQDQRWLQPPVVVRRAGQAEPIKAAIRALVGTATGCS